MRLRHIALCTTAVACVFGCGSAPNGDAEKVGWTSAPVTVCAGGSTVKGVDVSEYQGTVDWGSVHASGVDFAIARVSDGTANPDPTFATNWSGIKAAGMVRGAYQFFRASVDPTAQADLLLNAVGTLEAGDLPPMADVEVMDGESGDTLVANLATWIGVVKSKTGRTPMIYAAPGFWDALPNTGQFASEMLVVANWEVSCPDTPTPWTSWQFWQYADDGSVPGISGDVDLDEYDGTLAQLQAIGGPAPYAAQYVSQSFPLATTALTMVEGQVIPSYIELKNVGSKTWGSDTHLGTTQPRDRDSVFADGTWLSPDRPAGVTGSVAPGGTYKFQFDLKAPDTAGTYDEYFGVVEDGVAWFSDPGQGGPPDDDLEVQVKVIAPEYRGTFKDQSFPLAPTALTVHVGDVVSGTIELTNSGTQSWVAGTTKLAPIPRDKTSPFADPSWLSPTRVSTVAANVAPGDVGRFDVKLDANTEGDFEVEFGLVEESVTWFADATLGGGPPDGFLRVHLVVVADDAPLDAGVTVEPDGAIVIGGGSTSYDEDAGDGGTWAAPSDESGSSGGCAVSAHTDAGASWAAAFLVLIALASLRRRAG